ncbi:hypothetical protein J7643_01555 [bacterium]|nr:hypothetical protein [bacterium]
MAAIAAALSVYLEAEVKIEIAKPVNPWGLAARLEQVGAAMGIHARDQFPTRV